MFSWWKQWWQSSRVRGNRDPGWVAMGHRTSGWSRSPRPAELLAELRTTAYACAMINAGICATFAPRLYMRLLPGEKAPKTGAKVIDEQTARRILSKEAPPKPGQGTIVEVIDHPLLTLLRSANEEMNGHELWETTALSLEVLGNAYWWLEGDPPVSVWPLPAARIRPAGASFPGDWVLDTANGPLRLDGNQVLHFRNPTLEYLYGPGWGPMRAAYEPAALATRFHTYRRGLWENAATPGVILSTNQPLGEEEVDRIESRWQQRFGRGGSGRLLVTDADFKVSTVQFSPADMASLAEAGATRAEIANAFGVPLAFLTSDTNLANLQAAEHQHRSLAILPRLRRRDDRLNEKLTRRFDPTGRLFLAADNPVPDDREADLRQLKADLRLGVLTVEEVRRARGLGPRPSA